MTTPKSLRALIGILQELKGVDPEFPLQYALCLCEIARDEGLSLTELAQRTSTPLSTTSRIIAALSSSRGRCGGMVKVKFSATEARRKELTLTARGQSLIADLTGTLENSAPLQKTA